MSEVLRAGQIWCVSRTLRLFRAPTVSRAARRERDTACGLLKSGSCVSSDREEEHDGYSVFFGMSGKTMWEGCWLS